MIRIILLWLLATPCLAQAVVPREEQGFTLRHEHDSLYATNTTVCTGFVTGDCPTLYISSRQAMSTVTVRQTPWSA